MENKAITTRQENYSDWYLDVIAAADLAEHAPVRGCMIIKPNGYAIWENIQKILDREFKKRGVKNAYFPLFIPESFLKKEAEHVEGFSPELAVVTHGGGKELEEPLVVRPTSETIMYEAYSRWIQSYRDLPLLINQWANIVRWEMRPRLFLRTTEFLWQEGHTVHATQQEAEDFALMILIEVYKKFSEEYLAMPALVGKKSESERFAGARQTFTFEVLTQDGKSLQAGTSHDLSDNFAKAFGVKYLNTEGESVYAYQTSWGVSTRLIGGIIMAHSDDKGLVLPPKIAPIEAVILPICREEKDQAYVEARNIFDYLSQDFKMQFDGRINLRPGEKFYEWEKKGVPVRIELGPKDLAENQCVLVRRDTGEKTNVKLSELKEKIKELLDNIQNNLYKIALERRNSSSHVVDSWEDYLKYIEEGGYINAFWCEERKCEAEIKEQTKSVTRCLPFDAEEEKGEHFCIHCGKKAKQNKRWVFSRSY